MKKNLIGPLLTLIALVIVGATFVYFYVQLNRMDKQIIADQTTISNDTAQVSQIVSFLNANTSQTAAPAATSATTPTNAKTTKK